MREKDEVAIFNERHWERMVREGCGYTVPWLDLDPDIIRRYARGEDVSQVIVGTEVGIIHRLRKENPGKKFIPASEQAVCPRMKLITLENILWSLQEMSPQVKVPEEIRIRAKETVDRMLMIGRG